MRFLCVLLFCSLTAVPSSLPAQTTGASDSGSAPASPAPQSATAPSPAAQSNSTNAQKNSTTPPLKLESLPPEPHTLTPQQIAKLREERILAATTQLARNEAAWGPARSTPGTSLEMIETGRKSTPQGIQITYIFKATGFKASDNLRLLQWPLDQNLKVLNTGLSVDAQGRVICPPITQGDCLSSMQPGDPVKFITTAARGEALRLALFDDTSKQHAETTAIPFPLLYDGKTCKLEAMLGIKNAALMLLEGVGFPPNKTLSIDARTLGEDHPITTTTSAKGQLLAAFMPVIANHDTGTTTLHYDGGPGCQPSLSFAWGPGSYHAVSDADVPAQAPAAAQHATASVKH